MEGWGITSIESNMCATPILASDVPGLRDSVKDGYSGYLFPYGDAKALQEKMQLLIDHPQLRETLSKQSLTWARQFDWDQSANTLYQLFERDTE
jgi:glycosyltransferase involved in cell wall biosynthesis